MSESVSEAVFLCWVPGPKSSAASQKNHDENVPDCVDKYSEAVTSELFLAKEWWVGALIITVA